MSKLTEKAVALLQEGEVNLVIGYEEGNHGTRPLFCRQAENADRLILDDRCTNNIAVYLTKRELTGTGKVAIQLRFQHYGRLFNWHSKTS